MASESGQDRRETLADIVAEMRNPPDIDAQCPWWADGGECGHCPLGGAGSKCSFRLYSDRIEAAWRREKAEAEANALAVGGIVEASRHTPGNAAAMREALEKAKKAICHHVENICQSLSWENSDLQSNCADVLCAHRELCEAKTAINAALSAPARNCDKTYRNKYDIIGRYVFEKGPKIVTVEGFIDWFTAPAAERKGEGA